MKRYIGLLILSGFFIGTAAAQPITVKAVIDSTNVLIGDQFELRIELEHGKSLNIDFPEIGDTLTGGIEVIERSPLDTFRLSTEEQIKIIQRLTITSFDTGLQVVHPFRFEFMQGNTLRSIETNPAHFYVHSFPLDSTKGPVDIKRPYAAPVTFKEVAPYLMGAILAGAIIFFIFYYLHRRKQNKPLFGPPPKPKEPAHVIALRTLDKIKEQKLWQKNQVKVYYSEISDTLRLYIEDRFEIQAMEYTTDETVAAFKKNKGLLTEKSFDQLKDILSLSDLVKFAKYEPGPDDHNMTLMNAYFFINDTKLDEIKEVLQPDETEGEEVNLK